jgi:SAM-dependent methyltransferase
MGNYPFDQAWDQERTRLTALEQALDPGTIRHLEAFGVGPGWRCWEVGAGAGSIAAWLCQRVGDEGHVLATDLEMTFLERLSHPNLALLRHDIVADDLPEGGPFDLVHARWLLEWIPDRRKALARMVSALKPGGWLLVEASDFVTLLHGVPVRHRQQGADGLRGGSAPGAGPVCQDRSIPVWPAPFRRRECAGPA